MLLGCLDPVQEFLVLFYLLLDLVPNTLVPVHLLGHHNQPTHKELHQLLIPIGLDQKLHETPSMLGSLLLQTYPALLNNLHTLRLLILVQFQAQQSGIDALLVLEQVDFLGGVQHFVE